MVILLVGNKRDLDAERQVSFLEASRFAQENGNAILPTKNTKTPPPFPSSAVAHRFFRPNLELVFLETSALTGENVEEAFLHCSKTILSKIETGALHGLSLFPSTNTLIFNRYRQYLDRLFHIPRFHRNP